MEIENDQLWNLKSIDNSMPPIIRLEYDEKTDKNEIILHNNLNQNLEDSLNQIKLFDSTLTYEINLLQKLLIKNYNALRKDIAMNLLKKLKKLLCNYKQCDIFGVLKKIDSNESNNKNKYINKKSSNYFLAREFYEFLLVKFYSSINLLKIIQSICKTCTKYLLERIYNAIYTANNLIFLSCIARIYAICKRILPCLTKSYNYLRKHLQSFKSTNLIWNSLFNLNDYPFEVDMNEIKNEIEDYTVKASEIDNCLNNQNDYQDCLDLGVSIRREDVAENTTVEEEVTQMNDESKWKRVLFKFYRKILGRNIRHHFQRK